MAVFKSLKKEVWFQFNLIFLNLKINRRDVTLVVTIMTNDWYLMRTFTGWGFRLITFKDVNWNLHTALTLNPLGCYLYIQMNICRQEQNGHCIRDPRSNRSYISKKERKFYYMETYYRFLPLPCTVLLVF